MANDKVYNDYLMHGRTKGSRNGISTTKGYTAIGQKAKGHWVNGHYVYDLGAQGSYRPGAVNSRNGRYKAVNTKKLTFDTPKSYGGNVENTQSGAVSKPVSIGTSNSYRPQAVNGRNGRYIDDEYSKNLEYNSRKNDGSYEPQTSVASKRGGNSRYVDDEYSKNLEYNSQKNVYLKKPRPSANLKGAPNNWQQQGNTFRAANEAWERFGSGKSKNITGRDQKSNYGGYGTHASLEGSTRAMNVVADLGKLRREKKNLSLYGSGDTKTRNSRSDIANAFADAKADAKNAFKTLKKKAGLSIINKWTTGIRKDKKKKKSLKDFFK